MTDRVESKRFDPGKVCTYPGRLLRSRRGFFGSVSRLESWMTLCMPSRERSLLSGFLESYSSFQGEPLAWGRVFCL